VVNNLPFFLYKFIVKIVEKCGMIIVGDMLMDSIVIFILALLFLGIIVIITVLNLMQISKKKQYKKIINNLEVQKNILDSTPIILELDKIGEYLKSEKLEVMYNDWKERLENIKNVQIPKINDMIIETEYSLSQMNYKTTLYKIVKLEMEIYKVRTNSEFLLNEIKEITNSEEKNRKVITKLKAKYRDLYQKFSKEKDNYLDYEKTVFGQFELIAKSFEKFEMLIENKDFAEVGELVSGIAEMLKHLEIVILELPTILLLVKIVIPKRIDDIEVTYANLKQEGFPLDYLNIEYNIEESRKKLGIILEKASSLNLEDSLFELKVLNDYFENLFNDFEKEKATKTVYEETKIKLDKKLDKLNNLVNDIFTSIDDLKNLYDLSNDDIEDLNKIKEDATNLNNDYNILKGHTLNQTFAYSKLTKEIEILISRLIEIENTLDLVLNKFNTMHDDELRAREQLEEIRIILKDSKNKLKTYKLPVIIELYKTEVMEAQEAIKEIVKELNKKPITINVLNTRVDTARDLALKLYNKTNAMIKDAKTAEIAIVYGNRYRSEVKELNDKLTLAEKVFFKGEYNKSLEITMGSLNKIEPDIYKKIAKLTN
jgi:septation ring formation regulator